MVSNYVINNLSKFYYNKTLHFFKKMQKVIQLKHPVT